MSKADIKPVTAEEVYEMFWNRDNTIVDDGSWVGILTAGQSIVDGHVDFVNLAEWINRRTGLPNEQS